MTDQEKKAAFEGVLPLLVKNPADRDQVLHQYADAPKSSPMAAKMLEGASASAPFLAMQFGGKRMARLGLAATAANLAGMIAAAITKRRTAEEQAKADTGVLRNLAKLIPGVGTYDAMKRVGRQAQENVDRINERRAKRQAEKKAGVQGMAKEAFSWADVMSKIRAAKTWVNENPMRRALFGAGAGLAGGALLGRLVGGKSSTGTGAAIGALAGVGAGAYWNDIRKAIDAVKPVAGNAARKTRDFVTGMFSGGGKGDETEANIATQVARDAAKVNA